MMLRDGYTDVPAGKVAAVVTSLEMRAPVTPRPELPGGAWTLRRQHQPSVDWYRDLYRRVGEDWLWFSRLSMPDAQLAAILGDERVEIYALDAVEDGKAEGGGGAGVGTDESVSAGHASLSEGLLELDFRVDGECELVFFGVTPPLVGKGAGRWMMNRAIEIAWARPIQRFWLHTCTIDHPGALPFYIRSGFTPFRRQIEIADDPRLTGVAPRYAAPHVPIIAIDPIIATET
jgi:GNAT superfamily N-acetyltransferase